MTDSPAEVSTTRSRKRMVLGLVSQGTNSGGNMLLTVFVARHTSAVDYGAWALGYAAYMTALAIVRALAATPLLLGRYPSSESLRRAARGALALSVATGVAGGVVLVVLASVNNTVLAASLAMAVSLPVLLGQDCLRYHAFARELPGRAVFLDTSWLLCQLGLFVVMEISNTGDAVTITLAWAAATLPGAVLVAVRSRVWPGIAAARAFWRSAKDDALRLLADAAIATAATQALPVVVAAAAGLAAAGALRGGLTLMGVMNILVAGLTPVAIMSARHEHDRTGRLTKFLWEWNVTILVVSTLNGLLLWGIPDRWGRAAMGGTWAGASVLLLPLVLQSMIRGPVTGVPVALRATDRVGQALRLRVWTTIPALVFPWGGAILDGAMGAVWGILVSAAVGNIISISWMRRAEARAASAHSRIQSGRT